MEAPLLPPQIPKNGIWGRDNRFSPPFSFFENVGDTAGVNFALKTTYAAIKQFILEF